MSSENQALLDQVSHADPLCQKRGSQEWREVKGALGGFCAVAASVLVKPRPQFPSIPTGIIRHGPGQSH